MKIKPKSQKWFCDRMRVNTLDVGDHKRALISFVQRNMYNEPFESEEVVEIETRGDGVVTISQGTMGKDGHVIDHWGTPALVYLYPEVIDAVIEYLWSIKDEVGVQVAAQAEKARQEKQDADRRTVNPDAGGDHSQEGKKA